jgi:hypothetical protein
MRRLRIGVVPIVFIVAVIATVVVIAVGLATASPMDQLWLIIWLWTIGLLAIGGGLAWLLAWVVDCSHRAWKAGQAEDPLPWDNE